MKGPTQIHISKREDSEHVDQASEIEKLALPFCVDEEKQI